MRQGRAASPPTAGICGTRACSCSPRGHCWRRWRPTHPRCCDAVRRAVAERQTDLDFIRLGVEAFTASPSISLDYAVAEHTSRAAVVPADIGWSDVGSWGALWELGRKDAAGNVAVGDVLLEGARNCYVRSDGMLAAVVGPGGRGGRGDRRRRAGNAPRPRTGREEGGGSAEGGRASRGRRTQSRVPALGFLREPDPGRPLPGQAHRRLARRANCRCRSISIAPSTGWW